MFCSNLAVSIVSIFVDLTGQNTIRGKHSTKPENININKFWANITLKSCQKYKGPSKNSCSATSTKKDFLNEGKGKKIRLNSGK